MENPDFLPLCDRQPSQEANFLAWLEQQKLSRRAWKYLLPVVIALSGLGANEAIAQQARPGERGFNVTVVQERLRELGYFFGTIDGVYGPQTQAAVTSFQRAQGLYPDGFVQGATETALFRQSGVPSYNSNAYFPPARPGEPSFAAAAPLPSPTPIRPTTLQPGNRGIEVRRLQERLRERGYDPGTIDGVYGPQTTAAVRRFQSANELRPDGIADSQTLVALGLAGVAQQNRYIVVIPGGQDTLLQARRAVSDAFLAASRRGQYVNAGSFNDRNLAESRSYLLRSRGLDARVVRF
ncbi:MAG: peptidoglycan-binding protein [Kastovskya adunca ATA6-11-RM4]|jgi:peptidoglycan hydrolase-like protein with peptidoglycan-binding domain|nr:peptidoglycan-binding protein [Kastovskya adunca ATA6-11-RM4]